jgi:hypothetical protein
MMFGGMGMMPDPSAFGAQTGFLQGQAPYGQAPAGVGAQGQFPPFGGYPPAGGPVPPAPGQQLQPPKYPSQRMGSPARMGSPGAYVYELGEGNCRGIPAGPQAMAGPPGGYWGGSGNVRGNPRNPPRRY